ncbi:MAG TPA: TetR/AcrR family transcriptional regulator [Beijerinckiaceae bacterium]|nr:TetR/AcrR family transcriptional regulator [Beijerinckiaceae bacterium]
MPKLSPEIQVQRQEHILDAAELCFARTGFHRTTMQDICRAARVSAGAVYVYFASKEALIEGIVQRDRDSIMQKLNAVADSPDFLEGLRCVMKDCVLEQPAHKSALFLEIGAEATRNPLVSRLLTEFDRALRQKLESLLARARGEGRIAADVDPRSATLVMAMLGDAMMLRRATDPSFDPATIGPVILNVVARLLGLSAIAQPVLAGDVPAQTFAGVAE